MDKTSTPLSMRPTSAKQTSRTSGPSKKTIDVIRQFARIYMPMPTMPGVVLN